MGSLIFLLSISIMITDACTAGVQYFCNTKQSYVVFDGTFVCCPR